MIQRKRISHDLLFLLIYGLPPLPPSRVVTVKHNNLPYLASLWVNENSLVCAGYDYYPVLWSHDDAGKLTYINKLDAAEKKQAGRVRYGGVDCILYFCYESIVTFCLDEL